MTAAVIDCLQQAIDEDKNEMEVTLEAEATEPVFSDFRIHRFPGNRQMKVFISCLADEAIALNRIAIDLDAVTKALRLTMPNHNITKTGAFASCYRLTPNACQSCTTGGWRNTPMYRRIAETWSEKKEKILTPLRDQDFWRINPLAIKSVIKRKRTISPQIFDARHYEFANAPRKL